MPSMVPQALTGSISGKSFKYSIGTILVNSTMVTNDTTARLTLAASTTIRVGDSQCLSGSETLENTSPQTDAFVPPARTTHFVIR